MKVSFKAQTKGLKFLNENLEDAKNKHTIIGVYGEQNSRPDGEDGKTNAQILYETEEGIGKPKRSVLKEPIEANPGRFEKVIEFGIGKNLNKPDAIKRTLALIGAQAKAITSEAFDTGFDGKWKRNSAYTIKKKGFDKPNVETGELQDAVAWKVVDRNEKV